MKQFSRVALSQGLWFWGRFNTLPNLDIYFNRLLSVRENFWRTNERRKYV